MARVTTRNEAECGVMQGTRAPTYLSESCGTTPPSRAATEFTQGPGWSPSEKQAKSLEFTPLPTRRIDEGKSERLANKRDIFAACCCA